MYESALVVGVAAAPNVAITSGVIAMVEPPATSTCA